MNTTNIRQKISKTESAGTNSLLYLQGKRKMILEHGKDSVSAKWNNDAWDIGEKTKYRWITNTTNEVKSDWFYDIKDALQWITQYDRNNTITS
jgi:hypothetical protein